MSAQLPDLPPENLIRALETLLRKARPRQAARRSDVVNVPMQIGDGTAAVLTDGQETLYRLGVNSPLKIVEYSLAADPAGTVAVDVLVGDTLAALTSIVGSHPPTLTASSADADHVPETDWTTRIADKQWIKFVILADPAPDALKLVSLTLRCQKLL